MPDDNTIDAVVHAAVSSFAEGFSGKHLGQRNDPDGIIRRKIHNVFIEALGPELQYYTALARSFDSSLGNMLEKLGSSLARTSFQVADHVVGVISENQRHLISDLTDRLANRRTSPSLDDYAALRNSTATHPEQRRRPMDYYLIDTATNHHHLIELKIGGDLDTKKARSEKEAILERYVILANSLPASAAISIHFATAYNRFGEDADWQQGSVRQYFSDEELLIGRDFWNFVTRREDGYDAVLASYREHAHLIKGALDDIRTSYLGDNLP